MGFNEFIGKLFGNKFIKSHCIFLFLLFSNLITFENAKLQ